MTTKRSIAVVLFPEFEALDVYGPIEIFGGARDQFDIFMVAEHDREIASGQGPKSVVDRLFDKPGYYDILLVPGGQGTRREIANVVMLDWLKWQAKYAECVISVCTGSALLARAGILDGVRATTNKLAFTWVSAQGPKVKWQKQARWVEDGKFFTSSGVSAGMDMSLAVIQKLLGDAMAEQIAVRAEYEWHRDAHWDPFAQLHGLV